MATTMNVVQSRELYSSGDEQPTKVRKPYTITKQRERWTEDEHKKFLEALKLYGRAWQRIEEHIGTKTAVQIRSHAQKFFTKVTRETATNGAGSSNSIEIPPPRPKRKPMHPYPRKLANICKKGMVFEQDNKPCLLDPPPMGSSAMISSVTQQDNRSPSSASSVNGRDLIEPNQMNCEVPVSPVAGSSTHDQFGPVNGFSSPSSSANLNLVGSFVSVHDNGFPSPDLKSKRSSWLDQPSTFSNVDSSNSNAKEEMHSEETDSGSAIKDPSTETSSTSLKLFGQTVLVNPASAITTKSRKSSFSTFQKEYSLENFTSNEVIPNEKEAYSSCEPHESQEIESSDEAPRGSLQAEAWNLWSCTNPQMVYWLQCQQGDSDSKLDCTSVAPWWALYGNFPFSFVQHLSLNDPSNAQGRDDVTLDVSNDPCHSKIHALSNKKDKSSPLSSEATSVSDNDTIEKGSSTGQERDEDPESSGFFSRKVSFRSSGTGFLPYKRCVAETNGENMQQFDESGEEKRIRLFLY